MPGSARGARAGYPVIASPRSEPVRLARLLRLPGLRLDPQPRRLPGRPAQLHRPAPPGGRGDNPQDVLLARRPDLQYLPLTCANTNTALPYIDLVNETLEYFVANGLSIAGYQGHDTDAAITSAELIASPQYVNDAAYAALRTPTSRRRCRSTGR